MNPIEAFKRWRVGMRNLTIAQQLHGKIAGLYGNIIGLSSGAFSFAIYMIVVQDWKWWWTLIVLIAGTYLNIIELIGTKQQYKQACLTQDLINEQKVKQ